MPCEYLLDLPNFLGNEAENLESVSRFPISPAQSSINIFFQMYALMQICK